MAPPLRRSPSSAAVLIPSDRLLVVDDQKEIRQNYREFLAPLTAPADTASGYEVIAVPSGEAAIRAVQRELRKKRRIIGGFFDLKMGSGLNGIQTIQEIWKLDADIHCCIVTAYHDLCDVNEIDARFGPLFKDQWDFLHKPFTQAEICQKARQMTAAWHRKQNLEIALERLHDIQNHLIQSERLAAVGQAARAIGHEFGNLLTTIVGKAELAVHETDPDRLRQKLDAILLAAQRGAAIVKNLQTISRTGGARPRGVYSVIDLGQAIRDTLLLVNHLLKKSSIELVDQCAPELMLRGNSSELGQVFLNLILNSIYAMPKGGRLEVGCRRDGKNLTAWVRDDGEGIPAAILPKIFEPTFTTKGDQGNGLGLFISKQIVENHQGTLKAVSSLGQGAAFPPKIPAEPGMTDSLAAKNQLVVLVAEDDAAARSTIVEYLRTFGFQNILEANDGYDAYCMLSGLKIDLVICDWEMPYVSGIELLQGIRANERTAQVPFIMVTSKEKIEANKVEQAAMAQVDDFLIKPFQGKSLRERIESALNRKKPEITSPSSAAKGLPGALVVEHDAATRTLVSDILDSMGYHPIIQASTGESGYQLLQENLDQIGVVISDWEMPNSAGIEFLRKVRENPGRMKTLPFLMVASVASLERLKTTAAVRTEVDEYLTKPFTPEELKKRVVAITARIDGHRRVANLLAQSRDAALRHDLEEAERLARSALAIGPKSIEARLQIAWIMAERGKDHDFDHALAFLREAIKLDPDLPSTHIALALTFEKGHSLDKAIQVLLAALTICPPDPGMRFQLGRLLARRGRTGEAIGELRMAVALDPGHDLARVLLEELEKEKGN